MAWTQADLDTLKAAIATGAKKVTFGAGPDKREVEYRSLDEMKQTLADIERDINPNSAAPSQYVGAYNPNLG